MSPADVVLAIERSTSDYQGTGRSSSRRREYVGMDAIASTSPTVAHNISPLRRRQSWCEKNLFSHFCQCTIPSAFLLDVARALLRVVLAYFLV